MTPEEFVAAKVLENEGWEYVGTSNAGCLSFARVIAGMLFAADIRVDM